MSRVAATERYQPRVATEIQQRLAFAVRSARARLNISQDELGDRCGLHRTYIGGIERAERNISLRLLEKLASALGVSAAELIAEPAPNDD